MSELRNYMSECLCNNYNIKHYFNPITCEMIYYPYDTIYNSLCSDRCKYFGNENHCTRVCNFKHLKDIELPLNNDITDCLIARHTTIDGQIGWKVNKEPIDSYTLPKKPVDSYTPPKNLIDFYKEPIDSYTPPKNPIDFYKKPVDSYTLPKIPIDSYTPPKNPIDSYTPPKNPIDSYKEPIDSYTSSTKTNKELINSYNTDFSQIKRHKKHLEPCKTTLEYYKEDVSILNEQQTLKPPTFKQLLQESSKVCCYYHNKYRPEKDMIEVYMDYKAVWICPSDNLCKTLTIT